MDYRTVEEFVKYEVWPALPHNGREAVLYTDGSSRTRPIQTGKPDEDNVVITVPLTVSYWRKTKIFTNRNGHAVKKEEERTRFIRNVTRNLNRILNRKG